MCTQVPLFVGNSPDLPARFPSPNHSFWDFADDTVQNKTAFRAYDALFNATWQGLLDLIRGIDVFNSGVWTASTPAIAAASTDVVPYRPTASALPTPTSPRYSLQALTLGTLVQVFRYLGILSQPMVKSPGDPVSIGGHWVSQAEFTTAAFDTWESIIRGWWELFLAEFLVCQYDTELTGTNTRYSLLQGLILTLGPAILIAYFVMSIPTAFIPALAFISPIFLLAGPLFGIAFWVGFSTGWKILCAPTAPPILFSTMLMQFTATSLLFNKCPMLTGGLVEQTTYDKTTCMRCDLWSSGAFTMFSCRDDLGWNSPLDVPVFWLKACQNTGYFCSDWLTALQTPSDWNAFVAAILRTQLVSDWLKRWNDVDLSNEVIYSAQYTCAYELIPAWVVLITLLGVLLTYGAMLSPPRSIN